MSLRLLLLVALTAAAPAQARDPRLCLALQVPMSDPRSAALDERAQRMIDRFARGSPLEDPTIRNALQDGRVRLAILPPYGATHWLEQNRRLSLERGQAISGRIAQHGVPTDRIRVVPLLAASAYAERAGLNPADRWDWGHVIIEYPEPHDCTARGEAG
jgi:hypothetical protein